MRRSLGVSASLVVLAAACAGQTVVVSDGDGGAPDASAGADASVEATAGDARVRDVVIENDPKCLGYDSPGHCTLGLKCTYAQGTCACLGYCGGPPPDPDTDYSHWNCVAWRTDGCPDEKPIADNVCATEGLKCTYGDCCVTDYTCKGGTWSQRGPLCPP